MNYVCSDIHGRWNRYEVMIKKIKPTDHLYILGDMIDRYTDGLKILFDIMKRDNITFILGNHEWMLYQSMFLKDKHTEEVWCSSNNGGILTRNQFLELTEDKKNQLKKFLEESFVYKEIVINDKKYHLSHAGAFKEKVPELKVKDAQNMVIELYVWGSILEYYNANIKLDPNKTYIVGHRFVQNFHRSYELFQYENIIDIDGGCSIPDPYMKNALILYCIDNGKVEYITNPTPC